MQCCGLTRRDALDTRVGWTPTGASTGSSRVKWQSPFMLTTLTTELLLEPSPSYLLLFSENSLPTINRPLMPSPELSRFCLKSRDLSSSIFKCAATRSPLYALPALLLYMHIHTESLAFNSSYPLLTHFPVGTTAGQTRQTRHRWLYE